MKNRPMLTLEDCRKITAAAEAEARKNNWSVVIAILDDGGHLLHLARMDGASPANARIAVEKGRAARPDLELGICGEHGGDPESIAFFHSVGLDYVSCSPFRVPVARLAAAQAALADPR